MKIQFDHDYHIHSQLSLCSNDPRQSTENILAYAKRNRLYEIVLTDHYWDSEHIPCPIPWYQQQNLAHIQKALPLPQDESVRFYFGCETEMRGDDMTLGISREAIDHFDFVIVPTTHFHMPLFPQNSTSQERACAWVARFDALLSMDLPFMKMGIAHLGCPLIDNRFPDGALRVLRLIPDSEMERLFTLAARLHLGIELNEDPLRYNECEREDLYRPFRIAKSCGCKFYFGSDAHVPADLEAAPVRFKEITESLGLTEDDKFHPFAKEGSIRNGTQRQSI